MTPTREWTDTAGAAELLGWTSNYLCKQRRAGIGPPYSRVSERTYRYKISDVIAWLESRKVEGSK